MHHLCVEKGICRVDKTVFPKSTSSLILKHEAVVRYVPQTQRSWVSVSDAPLLLSGDLTDGPGVVEDRQPVGDPPSEPTMSHAVRGHVGRSRERPIPHSHRGVPCETPAPSFRRRRNTIWIIGLPYFFFLHLSFYSKIKHHSLTLTEPTGDDAQTPVPQCRTLKFLKALWFNVRCTFRK